MREIKFRAWFTLEDKMVNSDDLVLNYDGEDTFGFAFDKQSVTDDPETMKGTLNFKLMQFTGLKDINGKEIYEGDFVKWTRRQYTDCSRQEVEEEKTFSGTIYWHQTMWAVSSKGYGHMIMPYYVESDEFEVIGNIYENQNLVNTR